MKAHLLVASLVALSVIAPVVTAADTVAPVLVKSVGPKKTRVRVAAGNVLPCESSSNTKIYEGNLLAGEHVDLKTTELCVCVEHTHGAFSQTDWGQGEVACRPRHCDPTGTLCRPTEDSTIRITVSSNE